MATNTQDNNQLCHSNITPISHSQTLQSKRHVPPNTRLHQSKYAGNTTLMFSISAHNTWQRQTRNRRKHKYHTVAILSISAQKLNPNNTVLHSKNNTSNMLSVTHVSHRKGITIQYQIKHPPQPPTSTLANPIGKANISTNTTVHTVTVPIPYTQKPLVINDKTIITYQHTETHTTIFPTIIQVKSASLYPQANNLSEIQIFYYPTRINIANTNKTPIIRACNNYKREYKQLPSVITDLTPANHPHTVKQQTSNSTSQNTLSKSHNKHQTKVAFTQTDYTSQTTSNTQVCTTTNITTKTQHRIQLISKVSKQSKPLTKQTYPQQNYQAQHLHHIGNYTNHKHNKSPDPTPNQHHTISTTCPNPLYSGIKPNNTRVAVLHYFSLSSPKSLRNCTVCPFINLSIIEARSSQNLVLTKIPAQTSNTNTISSALSSLQPQYSVQPLTYRTTPPKQTNLKEHNTPKQVAPCQTNIHKYPRRHCNNRKTPNSLIAVTQIFYNHITPYLKQIRKLYQVTKHANHQSITNTTTSKHSTTIPQQTSAANKPTTGNLQSMLRPKYTNACNYKPNYPVQVNKSSTQQQAPKLITIAGSECVQSLEHKPCATKTTHIKKLQISVTRPKRITNPAITCTRITPTSLLIKSNKYNHNIQPYTNNWASGHHLRSIIQQHSNQKPSSTTPTATNYLNIHTGHKTMVLVLTQPNINAKHSSTSNKQDTPQAKYHVTTQLSHGFNIVNKVVPKMYSRQAPVLYHKHPMHGSKLQTNAKFTLTTLLVQLPLKGINAPKLTKYNPNPHNTVNHLGTLTYQYQSLIVNTIIANQTTIIYHNPKHITFSQSTAPSLVKPQVKPIRTTRRKHDAHTKTPTQTTIPVLPTSKRNQYNPSVYHHHPAALTTILNQQVHHSLPKPTKPAIPKYVSQNPMYLQAVETSPKSLNITVHNQSNSKTPTFKVKYKNNQTTNLPRQYAKPQRRPTRQPDTTLCTQTVAYPKPHPSQSHHHQTQVFKISSHPKHPIARNSQFCNNNTHTQHRALKTRTPSGSSMHKPKPVHTKETRQPYPQTTYHQNTTHKTHSYSTLNLQHQKPLMNLQPKSTQTHPKTPKFPQQQYLLQPGLHHANLQELISHVKPNIQVHTNVSQSLTQTVRPKLRGARLCCHNGVPAQTITPNGAYQHTLSTTNHSHQPKTSIRAHATKQATPKSTSARTLNLKPIQYPTRNPKSRGSLPCIANITTTLKFTRYRQQTPSNTHPTNCKTGALQNANPTILLQPSKTHKLPTPNDNAKAPSASNPSLAQPPKPEPKYALLHCTRTHYNLVVSVTTANTLPAGESPGNNHQPQNQQPIHKPITQAKVQQFKHNQPSPGTTFTHHNAYWESKPQPSKSHNKNNCQFTHQQGSRKHNKSITANHKIVNHSLQANLNTECVKAVHPQTHNLKKPIISSNQTPKHLKPLNQTNASNPHQQNTSKYSVSHKVQNLTVNPYVKHNGSHPPQQPTPVSSHHPANQSTNSVQQPCNHQVYTKHNPKTLPIQHTRPIHRTKLASTINYPYTILPKHTNSSLDIQLPLVKPTNSHCSLVQTSPRYNQTHDSQRKPYTQSKHLDPARKIDPVSDTYPTHIKKPAKTLIPQKVLGITKFPGMLQTMLTGAYLILNNRNYKRKQTHIVHSYHLNFCANKGVPIRNPLPRKYKTRQQPKTNALNIYLYQTHKYQCHNPLTKAQHTHRKPNPTRT
eukprot:gene13195-9041_t